MVGRGKCHSCHVRNCQTDESDRTAECRHRTCQKYRCREYQHARATDIESHRAGVVLAQKQQVERFDRRHRQHQTHHHNGQHQHQFAPRDIAQRAHRPHHKCFQCRLIAQILKYLHDRIDRRREHHSEDQNDHNILDAAAHGEYHCQYQCRADPRCTRQSDGLHRRSARHAQQRRTQQKQRHAQART